MAYSNKHPRIAARLLRVTKNKLFFIAGYGYIDDYGGYNDYAYGDHKYWWYYDYYQWYKAGALDSIEIYDLKKNKILCHEMDQVVEARWI